MDVDLLAEIKEMSRSEKENRIRKLENELRILRIHLNDIPLIQSNKNFLPEEVEVLNYLINKFNNNIFSASMVNIADSLGYTQAETNEVLSSLLEKMSIKAFNQGRNILYTINEASVRRL